VLCEQYNICLLSDSDAKLGERVVVSEYERRINEAIPATADPNDGEPKAFRLRAPRKNEWLCGGIDIISKRHTFDDENLRNLLDDMLQWGLHWKVGTDTKGDLTMKKPTEFRNIVFKNKTYNVRMGGLHSQDGPLRIASDVDTVVFDIDAASCYPRTIIVDQIAPDHVDKALFCSVFEELTNRRMAAKKAGRITEAAGLKVAINGVYGKFGSKYWNPLQDPPKRAAVSMNGELMLLRFIELLHAGVPGLETLSANTDGCMVRLPRKHVALLDEVTAGMYATYGLDFEKVEVEVMVGVDVNNYVYSYQKNGGRYLKPRGGKLRVNDDDITAKNACSIIKHAALQELMYGTPIVETIMASRDIVAFADYADVGKDYWLQTSTGERLQTHVRWYITTGDGVGLKKVNKHDGRESKLPNAANSVVIDDLPDGFPEDINYAHYIAQAQKTVDEYKNLKRKKTSVAKDSTKLNGEEHEEWRHRRNAEEPNIEYLRTIYLNTYRDLYVGQFKNSNYYDSMLAVLGMLWRNQHLKLTKADLIWCARSFDSSVEWWSRKNKIDDLMRYIDWLVTTVPVSKDVLPDDERIPVSVKVLDGPPGSGKTRHSLLHIVTSGPNIYWLAIGKINPLASERHDELFALAQQYRVRVDFLAIHCEANGRGTMKMQIDKRAAEIASHPDRNKTIFVTLITHKTLIDHHLTDVIGTLMIDEPVQVWEQKRLNFPRSYRTLRSFVEPVAINNGDAYDADIAAKIEADTQAVRLRLTEHGLEEVEDQEAKRDTINGAAHRWVLEQAHKTSGRVYAFTEQWNELEAPDSGELDVLALLHPRHIAHFDDVWMMAAFFKELMIYHLWDYLYEVTWNIVPIPDGWQREVELRDRVTLYYVLQNRDVTDYYLSNGGSPGRRRSIAKAVAEHFNSTPFIWSVNEHLRETGDYAALPATVKALDGSERDAYLTPRANGINAYAHLTGAAWLGTIKLPSCIQSFMQAILGYQTANAMILRENELYAAMQFLTRINTRRFDSSEPCEYVVMDKTQAEYIARICDLRPDRVLPLPMRDELRSQLNDVQSKGRGRKAAATDDELRQRATDRKRRRRADKAAADDVTKKADAEAKRAKRAAKATEAGRTSSKNGRPKMSDEEKRQRRNERLRRQRGERDGDADR
jgi:hypothetical protein